MASVLTFIILVLYAYYDLLEVKWSRLLHHLGPAFAILVVAVIGAKEMIRLRDNYQNLYLNLNIEGAIENPVSSKILTFEQPGTPRPTYSREVEPLEAILKGGVLKVGYDPDNIPYCYFNNSQQIVGYDIAFAYELARDLDCTIEFIPLNLDRMGPDLSSGRYDIAMSAIIMNETRILTMDFTHPYTEQDNVLVVRSKDRSRFLKLKEVVQHPNLRIGADGGYVQVAHRHFPLATLVQDKNILQELKQKQLDAVIWSHIPGFVWCLAHPEYTVVDYDGLIGKRYFAYPIPTGSFDWGSFLNNWLILKEQSGFKDRMHKYWIQGESPKTRPPRWSLLQALLRRNE
jgi:ABC-type amino acid transport substrate-binding protein